MSGQWIPPIDKGVGKLTPDVWDAFREAAMWFAQNKEALERMVTPKQDMRPITTCLARITASSAVTAGKQWRYGWEQVWPEAGVDGVHDKFQVYDADDMGYDGNIGSSTIESAWNIAESVNLIDTTRVNGILIANLSGFELKAIPDDTVVVMHFFRGTMYNDPAQDPEDIDTDATIIPYFSVQNHVDGECS